MEHVNVNMSVNVACRFSSLDKPSSYGIIFIYLNRNMSVSKLKLMILLKAEF